MAHPSYIQQKSNNEICKPVGWIETSRGWYPVIMVGGERKVIKTGEFTPILLDMLLYIAKQSNRINAITNNYYQFKSCISNLIYKGELVEVVTYSLFCEATGEEFSTDEIDDYNVMATKIAYLNREFVF